MVRDGIEGIQGVCSFHVVLTSFPQALPDVPAPPMVSQPSNRYGSSTKVLIENGSDDHLVPDNAIRTFKDEFNAACVDWVFHDYADTPHGFALLDDAGYREAADRRSTQAMLAFFAELFPTVQQNYVAVNAANTRIPPAAGTPRL